MPIVLLDPTDGLLLRGISGPLTGSVAMPFDIGGAGEITSAQPFDIEAPYVGLVNVQVFDISGNVRVANAQVFDLGEVTGAFNVQPFDIVAAVSNPTPGVPLADPVIGYYTSLSQDAPVGATKIYVFSPGLIAPGTTIQINYTPSSAPPPAPPPTTPPAPTPTPLPPPTGPTYFISASGSDSTGDGSLMRPWRTIGKFLTVAAPGYTLYCRGGTYPSTTVTNVTSVSGTASAPITVRAYSGETPTFIGLGSSSISQFMHFQNGVAYWILDGMKLNSFKPGASGVVWVGNPSVSTHHITIRNCHFTATPGGTSSEQQVYLSYHADDVIVEGNTFVGAHVGGDGGTAINIGDHEPGPQRFMVRRNIMSHFGDTGAIWVNSPVTNGSILHNTFDDSAGTSRVFVRLMDYSAVTFRDNAGTTGTNGITPYYENANIGGDGVLTMDHNFWGQTFDSNHLLVAGQTGRGAASDGTDAGALDW